MAARLCTVLTDCFQTVLDYVICIQVIFACHPFHATFKYSYSSKVTKTKSDSHSGYKTFWKHFRFRVLYVVELSLSSSQPTINCAERYSA